VDGQAIQQAIINLIDNALKHSARGQSIQIGLAFHSPRTERDDAAANAQPKKRVLEIYVEDHGPGIPAGEHEKIFERFYRLGSELRRETQGIGIGLSIVKHNVAAHGGRVIVRSAPGEGSRFTIELPLAVEPET
jgi:two-component system sensor histidine kinase SenX3